MSFKKREAEADEMRAAGHGEAAAIHQIEDLIDEDELETKDADALADSREAADEIKNLSEENQGGNPDDYEPAAEADDEDYETDTDDEDDEAEDVRRLDLDDPDTLDSLVTVKVQGEEIEMPLREALEGTMRQRDYTKKTTEVAELKKEAVAKREAYAQELAKVGELFAQNMTPEQEAAYVQEANHVIAERQAMATEEMRVIAAREQQALAEAFGWNEAPESEVKQAKQELREYAVSQGYQQEEIDGLYDHRALLLIDKARRYDAMQEKGEKIRSKAKKSPTLKPGSTATRGSSKKRKTKDAWKRLNETGSAKAATELIEGMLD